MRRKDEGSGEARRGCKGKHCDLATRRSAEQRERGRGGAKKNQAREREIEFLRRKDEGSGEARRGCKGKHCDLATRRSAEQRERGRGGAKIQARERVLPLKVERAGGEFDF